MLNIILYIVSGIILLVAGFFQFKYFNQTKESREKFKNIFPPIPDSDLITDIDDESHQRLIYPAEGKKLSQTFHKILHAINNYMKKNRGIADYAVLKDLTDRQCDAIEEQIDSTSPVPIYIGLCGTLIGIVFGVGVLGFGGGIDSLLSNNDKVVNVENLDHLKALNDIQPGQKAFVESNNTTYVLEDSGSWIEATDLGADGIKNLLCGVAIAMLTTFLGVILTIIGSSQYKTASDENERKKNLFLNWILGEVLPHTKHDTESTLAILEENLMKFNSDFSKNSQNLSRIFDSINTTYQGQAEVLRLIDRMNVNDIATANVRVLKELQNCTSEINDLHRFLSESNAYLSNIEDLNKNLKEQYDRTQLIENMGKFFQDELVQIEQRKSAISKAVADVDLELQKSIEGLKEHSGTQYGELTKATTEQHNNFLKAVDAQQKALEEKLAETTQVLEELKNLVAVKDSMGKLVDKADVQSGKMDQILGLNSAIKEIGSSSRNQERKLAELIGVLNKLVSKGGTLQKGPDGEQIVNLTQKMELPMWAKVTGASTCGITIITCIIIILKVVFHIT